MSNNVNCHVKFDNGTSCEKLLCCKRKDNDEDHLERSCEADQR